MKWILIKESEEKFDIKKALKENGIKKIPSKASIYNDQLEFTKRKGYAGEKTIDAMLDQVKDAGWTKGGGNSGMSADGSSAGRSNEYVSPDGQLKFSYTKYYGSTSYDNYFSFTFKRIKKLEGDINEARISLDKGIEPDNWARIKGATLVGNPNSTKSFIKYNGSKIMVQDLVDYFHDEFSNSDAAYDDCGEGCLADRDNEDIINWIAKSIPKRDLRTALEELTW